MPTFSTRSWHRRIHDRLYKGDPPRSLCPYFWRVVGATLLAPLWVPGWLANEMMEQYGDHRPRSLWGVVGYCFIGAVVWIGVAFFSFIGYQAVLDWKGLLTFLGVLTLILGSIAGVVFGGAWLHDRYSSHASAVEEGRTDPLLPSAARAFKERVCPFIDWSDEA